MINKIIINWFEIQTWNDIILSYCNYQSGNVKELNQFNYPYFSWTGTASNFTREKNIKIKGVLKKSTKAELNSYIDTFLSKIDTDKEVDITVYIDIWSNLNEVRVWKWVITNEDIITRDWNQLSFCDFNIDVKVLSGSLEDAEYEDTYWYTANDALNTWTQFEFPLTILWSAITFPIIYFNFTDDNFANMILLEDWDWRLLKVEWTFISGDLLTIDSEEKTVRYNWNLIDYAWLFSIFRPGSTSLKLKIDWKSSFWIKYKKRWK